MLAVLKLLIVILVMSLAHELAHFEVARRHGVKAPSIGIGLKIPFMSWLSISRKIRGVQVTLAPLVFIAYVGITPEMIAHLSCRKKVAILAAGSVANLIIGVVFFAFTLYLKGVSIEKAIIGGFVGLAYAVAMVPSALTDVGNFSGPVGIFNFASSDPTFASMSFLLSLVALMAVVNISIGLVNLIPFPALDGGHIFFALLEKVVGNGPTYQRIYRVSNAAGFAFIIGLFIFVTIKDLGISI